MALDTVPIVENHYVGLGPIRRQTYNIITTIDDGVVGCFGENVNRLKQQGYSEVRTHCIEISEDNEYIKQSKETILGKKKVK
jgi:hypothetical protein